MNYNRRTDWVWYTMSTKQVNAKVYAPYSYCCCVECYPKHLQERDPLLVNRGYNRKTDWVAYYYFYDVLLKHSKDNRFRFYTKPTARMLQLGLGGL